MEKIISEKRFSAILALQNKQKQQKQGSYLFDINDKAIELALNPKRQINQYLIRNLKRDAKRILKRQKDTAPEFIDSFSTSILQPLENLVIEPATPYGQLVLRQYEVQVHSMCEDLHPYALYIFNDLEDNIPIKDTAKKLGLSQSLVKKVRAQLKNKIATIINN